MALARQPQQTRSRQTLERILDATEELLRKKPFEEINVAEIVGLARSSVGSFYARFGSKEGLLPLLYQRYDREVQRRGNDDISVFKFFLQSILRMASINISCTGLHGKRHTQQP